MKFLVDAPLPPSIAEFLRSKGHEASHVFERGWGRFSDKEILGAKRSGLILFRRADWKLNAICESLDRMFATIPEQRLALSIVVVEPSRIRVRNLDTE